MIDNSYITEVIKSLKDHIDDSWIRNAYGHKSTAVRDLGDYNFGFECVFSCGIAEITVSGIVSDVQYDTTGDDSVRFSARLLNFSCVAKDISDAKGDSAGDACDAFGAASDFLYQMWDGAYSLQDGENSRFSFEATANGSE